MVRRGAPAPPAPAVRPFLLRHAHRFIGIAVLLCILSRIDIARVAADLSRTRIPLFLLALCVLVPVIFLKAVRWNALLRFQRISLGMGDAFLIYWAGVFLGSVTPGRLGDFAKIAYVARLGHSLGRSIFSAVFDRLSDLFFFVALACLSGAWMARARVRGLAVLSGALVALLAAVLLRARGKAFLSRVRAALSRPLPGAGAARGIRMTGLDFLREVGTMDAGIIVRVAALSLAGMTCILAHYWMLAESLGIRLSPAQLTAAVTLSSVASLIPVSILGVGTRDAVLILIFARFGYARESALAFSFLIVLAALAEGVAGFFCWMRRPIDFRDLAALRADAHGDARVRI